MPKVVEMKPTKIRERSYWRNPSDGQIEMGRNIGRAVVAEASQHLAAVAEVLARAMPAHDHDHDFNYNYYVTMAVGRYLEEQLFDLAFGACEPLCETDVPRQADE